MLELEYHQIGQGYYSYGRRHHRTWSSDAALSIMALRSDSICIYYNLDRFSYGFMGRLRGLTVTCWITNHYHACSNLNVGIAEGCFIFDFASLPLEVARPI